MLSNNANPDLSGITLPKPGILYRKGSPILGSDNNWYIEDGLGGWLFLAAGTDPPAIVPIIERKINILPLQSAIISSVTNGTGSPAGGSVTIGPNSLSTTTTITVKLSNIVTFGTISVTSANTSAQIATKVQDCINTNNEVHQIVATVNNNKVECVFSGDHPEYTDCGIIIDTPDILYSTVPFTQAIPASKIIVINNATATQLLYNFVKVGVIGRDFEATNISVVVNGTTITVTCPAANISGEEVPVSGDTICFAYNSFVLVHNLNTFRVLMTAYVKTKCDGQMKRNLNLEAEMYSTGSVTANTISCLDLETNLFYYGEFMSLDIN